MFQLMPLKKKMSMAKYDYTFDNMQAFYSICNTLTVPLRGKYCIAVKEERLDEVQEFIAIADKYSAMMIDLICPQAIIDYISMRDQTSPVSGGQSAYEQFIELIKNKSILFDDKRTINVIYASIPHEYEEMDKVLDELLFEYGKNNPITKAMASKKILLTEITYPRQVLMAYLTMDRWRESKLKKCLASMGNDVTLGAMVKNITALMTAKQTYLKTGKENWQLKQIDTRNLLLMYRVLVVERNRLNDVTLLLDLYEKGVSSYDFVFGNKS